VTEIISFVATGVTVDYSHCRAGLPCPETMRRTKADERRKRDLTAGVPFSNGPVSDSGGSDRTRSDGVDRRGFLKCMAWSGHRIGMDTLRGYPDVAAGGSGKSQEARYGDGFSFVQISDSHIGFNKGRIRT
jgi:hypothetical protein